MNKGFNGNTKNNDEWLTPPEIIKALGKFDLDPCAPINPPWKTADCQYDKNRDGLLLDWHGRVWLNPPYGTETFKWIRKLRNHKSGIALIFARTETKGFHREIWPFADSIFFFAGRLHFHYVDGTRAKFSANASSCLISFSKEDTEYINQSSLKGKLIRIRENNEGKL